MYKLTSSGGPLLISLFILSVLKNIYMLFLILMSLTYLCDLRLLTYPGLCTAIESLFRLICLLNASKQ